MSRIRTLASYACILLIAVGAILMFLGLITGCGAAQAAAVENRTQTVGEWQYSVTVRIYAVCAPAEGAPAMLLTASGVAVGPRRIVTAHHVVAVAVEKCAGEVIFAVETFDGRRLFFNPERNAPEADAATMVEIHGASLKAYATPSTSPLRLDDEVCSVGGDSNVAWAKKCGRVCTIGAHRFASTIWTKPGNSGGPVFRGRELVGIISAARLDPLEETISIGVHTSKWVHLMPRGDQ